MANQLNLVVTNAIIVPATYVYAVPPDPEDPNSDPVISIMAWVDYPTSIISLRMKQSLILRADPQFFNFTRNEGRRIRCTGEVSYMRIHGMNIPAVDARFSLGVFELEILPGVVPISGHFQTFLRIHEGPLHATRGTRGEGNTILDFRTNVYSFNPDREDPQDNRTGSQETPVPGSQGTPVPGSQESQETVRGGQGRPGTAVSEEEPLPGEDDIDWEEETEVQQEPSQTHENQMDLFDISEGEDNFSVEIERTMGTEQEEVNEEIRRDLMRGMGVDLEEDQEVEDVMTQGQGQKRRSVGVEPPSSALRRLNISSKSSQSSQSRDRMRVTRSMSIKTEDSTSVSGRNRASGEEERDDNTSVSGRNRASGEGERDDNTSVGST
ncbi:hypothetical protein BD770DRAFT_452264 [Pilaira anomala]|nr:hypothetical protein BD770DRAFT_452264 [Pilaira anomala]